MAHRANQHTSLARLQAVTAEMNFERRLELIEALRPAIIRATANRVDAESKAIDVFFQQELPAARAQIQKFKNEGKPDLAKPIEEAMATKTNLMVQRIEKNQQLVQALQRA